MPNLYRQAGLAVFVESLFDKCFLLFWFPKRNVNGGDWRLWVALFVYCIAPAPVTDDGHDLYALYLYAFSLLH